jgi:hypothetical protein
MTKHVLYGMSAYVILSVLWRFARQRPKRAQSAPEAITLAEIIYALLRCLGAALIGVSLWLVAGAVFPEGSESAGRMLAGAIAVSVLLEFFRDVRNQNAARCTAKMASVATLTVGISTVAGSVYVLSCPPGALDAQSPLTVVARVVAGGRTALTNYHHHSPVSQDLAVDLVCEIDGSPAEGAIVHAPVAALVDRLSTDTSTAEGNLVVLRSASGTEVWLAHLQEGSIQVKAGDQVSTGQPLARVGSTGNAVAHHLHVHAQWGEVPVPLVFGKQRQFVVRGDLLSP